MPDSCMWRGETEIPVFKAVKLLLAAVDMLLVRVLSEKQCWFSV